MQELYPDVLPTLPHELLDALGQPFAPQDVQLRPGKREQALQDGQWLCRAVPFASRRVYEARLDALAPGNWSTTTPSIVVASNRLVVAVQVQIGPIAHADYGELLLPPPADPNELGEWVPNVRKAFEQAFVGACQRFGLGRYLADLVREWVPYDRACRTIALSAEEQDAHILKLYRQADLPLLSASDQGMSSRTYPIEQEDPTARLRARDLAWVREQCDSRALANIYRKFQVSSLEELSDRHLVSLINGIHVHQQAS